MYEVKPAFKFSKEDMTDILCSCFEGGCGYWCCINNATVEWKEAKQKLGKDATIEDVMIYMMENDIEIILIDEEDDDKEYYLTLNKFLDGIKKSIEDGYWDGREIENVDCNVGDVIIQYAIFDDVIYG